VKSRYGRVVSAPSLRLLPVLAVVLTILLAGLSAGAQTPGRVPHIGYIWMGAEASDRVTRPGLQKGLRDLGYQEGRSVERLRELVADTVASKVDIIVVPGVIVANEVKRATATIPVVALVGDPLASGLVASLARPGANITGFSSMEPEYGGKLVELLHELVPNAIRAAVLYNPSNAAELDLIPAIRDAAGRIGLSPMLHELRRTADFATAFEAITEQQPDALVVGTDVLLSSHRKGIIEYAARHRFPAVYCLREFVDDGGLIS
jgi:putative tryptophan/tyrosine transport system substrate-binding protein